MVYLWYIYCIFIVNILFIYGIFIVYLRYIFDIFIVFWYDYLWNNIGKIFLWDCMIDII